MDPTTIDVTDARAHAVGDRSKLTFDPSRTAAAGGRLRSWLPTNRSSRCVGA